MIVQYCSDLHLEFSQNSDYLMENKIPPNGDILILAGDITYIGDLYFKHIFFDYISDNFKETYMIAGNHEFYAGFDLNIQDEPLLEKIRHNIYFVNNRVINIQGIDFFFTSLWSKIPVEKVPYVINYVADFKRIKYNGKLISYREFNKMHEISFKFLKTSITESKADKKVVVTHHVPSMKCNADEFKTSFINSAFVVELSDFIQKQDIDYWIFGHIHRNTPEISINGTKMLCNQLGYVHRDEHLTFNPCKTIEI